MQSMSDVCREREGYKEKKKRKKKDNLGCEKRNLRKTSFQNQVRIGQEMRELRGESGRGKKR